MTLEEQEKNISEDEDEGIRLPGSKKIDVPFSLNIDIGD